MKRRGKITSFAVACRGQPRIQGARAISPTGFTAEAVSRNPRSSLPHVRAIFVAEPQFEAGHAGWLVQGAKRLAKLMAELRGGWRRGGRPGRRRSGSMEPAGGRREAKSIRGSCVRLARLLPFAVQLEPQRLGFRLPFLGQLIELGGALGAAGSQRRELH